MGAALCGGGFSDAQALYAVQANQDILLQIDISDPDAPITSNIGQLGTDFSFGGLAYDTNDNIMYMIGGRGNNSLYTVNLDTGAATLVGAHGIDDLFGLTYDSSTGTLYATTRFRSESLYTIDQTTGASTLVGGISPAPGLDGLAYDTNRDRLVGLYSGPGDLYEVNRANGSTTLLNDGDVVNNAGLAYDSVNDQYWYLDFSSTLATIDPDTFQRQTRAILTNQSYDGLAYVIPTPASAALLGIAGLATTRRR